MSRWAAGIWIAAVVVLMVCSMAAGMALSLNAAELWAVVGLVPPGVMLLMWHPAPPVSVAELLHAGDAPPAESRRS